MKLVILAHDSFGPHTSKTGHVLVHATRTGWSSDEVVAIVDRSKAGRDAGEFALIARGIPIVSSVEEALKFRPDRLVVGIAPVGGALPEEWRRELRTAIRSGLSIWNGLHTFLSEDAELGPLSRKHGVEILDVRKPPPWKRIATGEGALIDPFVVLHVGTDCSTGKMTAAVELCKEARSRGLRAAFVATGQTGIMIGADAGVALDAVVSDFVAGTIEKLLLDVASSSPDIIFVEGQGCLSHPAYSGVSASLLTGSFPDTMVLSDDPSRKTLRFPSAIDFPKPSIVEEIRLNEHLASRTTGARVSAVALLTRGLSPKEREEVQRRVEEETGVVAGDVLHGGAGRILDSILKEGERRGVLQGGRPIPHAKRARYSVRPLGGREG